MKGFEVERKQITILGDETIKEVGSYKPKLSYTGDVKVKIKLMLLPNNWCINIYQIETINNKPDLIKSGLLFYH